MDTIVYVSINIYETFKMFLSHLEMLCQLREDVQKGGEHFYSFFFHESLIFSRRKWSAWGNQNERSLLKMLKNILFYKY